MPSLDPVGRIKYWSGQLNNRSSGAGRRHFSDELQVQLAGGSPALFVRRNRGPKFFVQGVGLLRQLRWRQRPRKLEDGVRNVFEGITELALQVLLHSLGMGGAFSAERE